MNRQQQEGPSHVRANQQLIKQQEMLNRERRLMDEEDSRQRAALAQKQRDKYSHVQSHGYGRGGGPAQNGSRGQELQNGADDVEIKVFVRECEPDGHTFVIPSNGGLRGPPPQQHRADPNPVERAQPNPRAAQRAPSGPPRPSNLGIVPDYIQKRKQELRAEQDAVRSELERRQEVSKYPPGHRPVLEEERLEILDRLGQRKKDLELELGRLPIRFDTQAIKTRRAQIENELAEVEAAERKFSVKKQLFVPI